MQNYPKIFFFLILEQLSFIENSFIPSHLNIQADRWAKHIKI